MARKIKPQEVAAQCDWDLAALNDFCADILEDANDHNIAAALRALANGDHDLAIDFIKLEKEHEKAGELTPALSNRRDELYDRLRLK
jgi:hypothetical protein